MNIAFSDSRGFAVGLPARADPLDRRWELSVRPPARGLAPDPGLGAVRAPRGPPPPRLRDHRRRVRPRRSSRPTRRRGAAPDKKQATNRRRVNMKYHMGRRLTVPPRLKEAQQKKIVSAYLAFEMDDDALRHLPGGAADVGPTPARLARGFSFGADDEDPELLALAEEALGPEVGDGGGAAAPAAAPLPLVTPGRRTPRAPRARGRASASSRAPTRVRAVEDAAAAAADARRRRQARRLAPARLLHLRGRAAAGGRPTRPPARRRPPARSRMSTPTRRRRRSRRPSPRSSSAAAAATAPRRPTSSASARAWATTSRPSSTAYGELESDDAKTSDDDGFGLECTETLPAPLRGRAGAAGGGLRLAEAARASLLRPRWRREVRRAACPPHRRFLRPRPRAP